MNTTMSSIASIGIVIVICISIRFPTFLLKIATIASPNARRYPLSYVYSGRYGWGGGNLISQDFDGDWWSTAAYSASNAYSLTMYSSNLVPQYSNNKAGGFTLRCVSFSCFILCPSVSAFVCIVRVLLLG